MIRGNESVSYSFKQVNADMWIEYWDFPTVGRDLPAANATGVSVTPTLTSTATNPGNRQEWFASSPWLSAASWTVPSDVLRPGTDYYWRAKVYDDANGWLGQSTVFTSYSPRKFTTNQVPLPPDTGTPGTATGLPQVLTTLTPQLQVDAVTDTHATAARTHSGSRSPPAPTGKPELSSPPTGCCLTRRPGR